MPKHARNCPHPAAETQACLDVGIVFVRCVQCLEQRQQFTLFFQRNGFPSAVNWLRNAS
jgi:hypothetical protein